MHNQLLQLTEYRERYEYEKSVIEKFGFMPYFEIIKDIIQFCEQNGILVGVGRGSVAGSLFAYVHGITKINPIKYGLVFERFINPERVQKSFPDVDIDVQAKERERVIQYLLQKYGGARICSYTATKVSTAVRDYARAYKISVKEIEDVLKEAESLEDLKANTRFVSWMQKNGIDEEVLTLSILRNKTVHPAGVILGSDIMENVPMMVAKDVVTQWRDVDLQRIGYLKIDVLGLDLLDKLNYVIETCGLEKDLGKIDTEDKDVFEFINNHRNYGVFHLEAVLTDKILKQYKVNSIEDIAVVLSIAKPALLQSGITDEVIKRRNGKRYRPIIKELEQIVSAYGLPVFQEDFMKVLLYAGMSLTETEEFREAIKKKRPFAMKEKFCELLMQKTGASKEQVEKVYAMLENNGAYLLNRAHAFSYAVMAYITAYMKYYYPRQFLAGYIEHTEDEKKKKALIEQMRQFGVRLAYYGKNLETKVLEDGSVQLGLREIKGIGSNANLSNRKYQEILKKYNIIADDDLFTNNSCENCVFYDGGERQWYNLTERVVLVDYPSQISDGIKEAKKKWGDEYVSVASLLGCSPKVDGVCFDVVPEQIIERCVNRLSFSKVKQVLYLGNYPEFVFKHLSNKEMEVYTMKIRELNLSEDALKVEERNEKKSVFYAPKVGEEIPISNIVRFIGSYKSAKVHFTKGLFDVSVGIPFAVKCKETRCPICEVCTMLAKTEIPEAIEKARMGKATTRYLWLVLPIGTLERELTPVERSEIKVLSCGVTVQSQLLNMITQYGHFGGKDGYLVNLSVQKAVRGTRYIVSPYKQKKKIGDEVVEAIVRRPLTAEEMELDVPELDEVYPELTEADEQKIRSIYFTKPKRERIERSTESNEYKCYGDANAFDEDDCITCKVYEACKEEVSIVS